MQKRKTVNALIYRLSIASAMTALSVVFCRFIGFSPENSAFRFEFGFLPVAFVGELFGPLWCAVSYLVADVIGSLFSGYAPNPWISGCKFLTGLVMGLFLYNKERKRQPSLLRISIAFAIIAAIIDFLFMSPILIALYSYTPEFAFGMRAINAAINLPIRVFSFYLVRKCMDKPLKQIFKNEKNNSFKSFANSFQAVTVPGLERISALLKKLGNPEDKLRFIHVAGTNGKGSVCANVASILSFAGYKVGKYISPNLVRVNERITVNGKEIKDGEMNAILAEIEAPAKEVEKEQGIAPTQFEIWTALAMVYFERCACDFVVLEVGLGGEFDATNVIKTNVISVITRLGLDHTQYLGNTISEVAAAKCGILKSGTETGALVTVEQEESAMSVIRQRAEKLGIELIVVKPESLGTDGICEKFSLFEDNKVYLTGIPGYHQIENAAIAVAVAKRLGVDVDIIEKGIRAAKNPARFELISENPTVIYDGGHNENGIRALNFTLERYYGNVPKTVVFACMRDKDISESLELLSHGSLTDFIFTEVKNNPRAMKADELQKKAAELGFSGMAFSQVDDAYHEAVKRGKLTVICGSLYLYKDFREFLDKEKI